MSNLPKGRQKQMKKHTKNPSPANPQTAQLWIVGGGIAAFKTPELVRLLTGAGAEVTTVLTDGGAQFVTPLTLSALSGTPCHTALWDLMLDQMIRQTAVAQLGAQTETARDRATAATIEGQDRAADDAEHQQARRRRGRGGRALQRQGEDGREHDRVEQADQDQ